MAGTPWIRVLLILLLSLILYTGARTPSHASRFPSPDALPELTLQELVALEVSSSARKDQTVSETAASVFVLTGEDIRRSGATSIPEVLRMVPGLLVARIDSNTWAISARSFNSRFANKLLVLVDGRDVLSSLLPSVFWETIDTLLEDIERIEVVRGPAATLWGANAVNGVVNIVTRSARGTQGTLLATGGGTEERAFAALRHGGRSGDGLFWRIYGKYTLRDDSHEWRGREAADGWEMVRAGFRADRGGETPDEVTLLGDVYFGREGVSVAAFEPGSALPVPVREDARLGGANLLARWEHDFHADSTGTLQLYYDRSWREETILSEDRQVFDLDVQHLFRWVRGQRILWGGGWRYVRSDFDNGLTFAFDRERRTEHRYNIFLQDEIELIEKRLRLTVGSRIEHNSFTEFEMQWNARLLCSPADRLSFWGAVSRASRTPGRFDRESRILVPSTAGSTPVIGIVRGNPDFRAEKVTAFELGLRGSPLTTAGFDLVGFYHDYEQVRSFDFGAPFTSSDPPPFHIVQPVRLGNNLAGETYGIELAAEWHPSPRLVVESAYTFSRGRFRNRRTPGDEIAETEEGKIPRHQISMRFAVDLPKHLEWDIWLRYVDRLRRGEIPEYLQLDARLAWRPLPGFEVSLVGQNLLDSHHPEFPRETLFSVFPTQAERSIYGKLLWQF